MTKVLYRLSRWCAEHAVLVIVLWVAVLLGLGGLNKVIGGDSPSTFVLSGTDSAAAQELLGQAFPGTAADANPLLLHSDDIDFGSAGGQADVERVVDALRAEPSVTAVTTPADNPSQLSADAHTVLINVTVNEADTAKASVGEALLAAARDAVPGQDIDVALGGLLGQKVSTPDTHESEIIGLLTAVLVLFLTMRRLSATLLPLVNALLAVGIGLTIVSLLNRIVFIPDVAPTLGTMLGLGVGIDYALFLIVRHRQLLRQGFSVPDAVGRTSGTAGAGIIFAGTTLIAAVCGLALTGLSFLAWLGYAAAIVVAVAVLASVTFVPAMLGLLGTRIERRGETGAVGGSSAAASDDELDRSARSRLATAVTRRPWPFAVGSTLLLLVLAAPTLTLNLGHADAGILPRETTARQAYDLTTAAFGPGATAPLAVVVRLYSPAVAPATGQSDAPTTPSDSDGTGGDPRTADPRLTGLRDKLAATPGVAGADAAVVSTDGGVAIVRVVPAFSGSDPRTEQLVSDLRGAVLPAAVEGQGMAPHVGGVTAATTDLSELIAARTVWFILGVVALSFVLLMIAYRSLLIPLKAALMNLLSIAAAYGVVTAVFQWGWGAQFIGLEGPVPIESYVPMMMFAVLFGLSMDYEVFLLTSFREHWERSGDMTVAVRRGLADTGKVVTSAALIMCVVFGSFVLSDNAIVKMFGVGLATAVFVDATIVRCLLVPAIMVLAQRGTWWLPGWLDRLLPHIAVEGDPQALDTVIPKARAARADRGRPAVVAGVWAAVGTSVAWLLAFLIDSSGGLLLPAAALSAVAGGVISALPERPSGFTGIGSRAVSFMCGAAAMAFVAGVVASVGSPARTSSWLLAWAVVVLGLVVVFAGVRTIWLPAALGGCALVVARMAVVPDLVAALSGEGVGPSQVLVAAVLPGLMAMLIAAAGRALTSDRGRSRGARTRAPEVAATSEEVSLAADGMALQGAPMGSSDESGSSRDEAPGRSPDSERRSHQPGTLGGESTDG